MNRLGQGIMVGFAALAFACSAGVANANWTDAAPVPDRQVNDLNGFFGNDPEVIRRIAVKLWQLQADHGYRIYVVVEPVLMSDNAPRLAAMLQKNWLPDGNGLVIVYEGDSRSLGIGRNVAPMEASAPPMLTTHQTDALLHAAVAATDPVLPPVEFMEALVDNLTREFNGFFERRDAPPPQVRSLRRGLLVVGLLALLALAVIGVCALTRLKSMTPARTLWFPELERPERLGAPCGARVTCRKISRDPQD
jgi:hypothetical protein